MSLLQMIEKFPHLAQVLKHMSEPMKGDEGPPPYIAEHSASPRSSRKSSTSPSASTSSPSNQHRDWNPPSPPLNHRTQTSPASHQASNKRSCPSTSSLNLFRLRQQPEENQRKAYRHENRYILPNPLVIEQYRRPSPTDDRHTMSGCCASVRLVHVNGEELDRGDQDKFLEGATYKPMVGSDHEKRAEFSLKALETSGRSKFKLIFTVHYTINHIQYEEVIVSDPFRVISNKKKNANDNIGRPKLMDLMPKQGNKLEETEVWIRGNCFTERGVTCVKFGNTEARIIEVEENLVICQAPPIPDLKGDLEVPVTVTNLHPQQGPLVSKLPLSFRYVSGNLAPLLPALSSSSLLSLGSSSSFEPLLQQHPTKRLKSSSNISLSLVDSDNPINQSAGNLQQFFSSSSNLSSLVPSPAGGSPPSGSPSTLPTLSSMMFESFDRLNKMFLSGTYKEADLSFNAIDFSGSSSDVSKFSFHPELVDPFNIQRPYCF